MSHSQGELARVTEEGLEFLTKGFHPLRALQVRPRSRLWGFFVTSSKGSAHRLPPLPDCALAAGRSESTGADRTPAATEAFAHHLVVSPIPVGEDGLGWLSAFRIEVYLRNRPGSIARMLDHLRAHGVTIHAHETQYSGYARTKFQAFASLTHVGSLWSEERDLLAVMDRGRSPLENDASMQEQRRRLTQIGLMQRSGVLMLGALAALEASMLTSDALARKTEDPRLRRGRDASANAEGRAVSHEHRRGGFLADQNVDLGSSPWYLSGFLNGSIEQFVFRARQHFRIRDFLPGVGATELASLLRKWFNTAREQSFTDAAFAMFPDAQPFRPDGAPDGSATGTGLAPGECIATLRQEIEYQLANRNVQHTSEDDVARWSARDQLARLHQFHWNKPVSCRALHALAFAAIFRNHALPVLEFQVKDDHSLELAGSTASSASQVSGNFLDRVRDASSGLTSRTSFHQGTIALVSVSGSEGWARARFLRPAWVDHCAAHIRVRYLVKRGAGVTAPFPPLVGLLHCVSDAVGSTGTNIESMCDELEEHFPEREIGAIEGIVFVDYRKLAIEKFRRDFDPQEWRKGVQAAICSGIEVFRETYHKSQGGPGRAGNPAWELQAPGADADSTQISVIPLKEFMAKGGPGSEASNSD